MHGSIQKRVGKRGVTWTAVVDLPPDPLTGKRRQKRLSAPTKREIEQRVAEHIQAVARGTYADPGKLTVAQFVARWLDSLGESVRPQTRRRYADLLRQHALPALGALPLAKLSPLHLQQLYAERLTAGLSPTTVRMLHLVLHRALAQAVRWHLVVRNPTESVRAPRRATPEATTWTAAQAAAFLRVADTDPDAALWRLALLTGLRRGELLGLKWEDLDLAAGRLSVRRTYSRAADGNWALGTPKSRSSQRAVALPPSVVAALRAHRQRQAAARLRLGAAYTDQGFVFATPTGRPLHVNTLLARFARLVRAAGVPPIRFHDLRHTAATLLLAQGTHPKIVQERLGHASIAMTLDRYSHATLDMQRDAAAQLDALLARTADSA